MPEVHDPDSMIEAARAAVDHGDYPAAERLLRDAAARQEADLGADHPDLAVTLNNLAFVCERLEKFDDAERGYRRAHAIAVASLSPRHPFTKTSLSNLVEFCATHDVPIWTPPANPTSEEFDDEDVPAPPAHSSPGDASIREFESEDALEEPRAPVVVTGPPLVANERMSPRAIAAAAVGVAAVVVVLYATQGQGETGSTTEMAAPAAVPPPIAPVTAVVPTDPKTVVTAAPRSDVTAASNARVTVLNAQLCRSIEKTGSPDWQCAGAGGEGEPGSYIFYTRLLTTAATTVEHRWYFNGRLHQRMRLGVSPGSASGFRTFSRNRVSPERTGDWKVELRSADGTLLQDARFHVR
jgi:hypothetical protein